MKEPHVPLSDNDRADLITRLRAQSDSLPAGAGMVHFEDWNPDTVRIQVFPTSSMRWTNFAFALAGWRPPFDDSIPIEVYEITKGGTIINGCQVQASVKPANKDPKFVEGAEIGDYSSLDSTLRLALQKVSEEQG